MALPNIFDSQVTAQLVERLEKIKPGTQPLWGRMNAGQMLAHCNVSYEYVFEPDKYKPASAFIKLMLKWFLKKTVVNEIPYKKNSQTGPDFKITDERDFEKEKTRLIAFITKTRELGANHFEGLESHSFGKLNATEWNNMFYKHLDHHFRQFGA